MIIHCLSPNNQKKRVRKKSVESFQQNLDTFLGTALIKISNFIQRFFLLLLDKLHFWPQLAFLRLFPRLLAAPTKSRWPCDYSARSIRPTDNRTTDSLSKTFVPSRQLGPKFLNCPTLPCNCKMPATAMKPLIAKGRASIRYLWATFGQQL